MILVNKGDKDRAVIATSRSWNHSVISAIFAKSNDQVVKKFKHSQDRSAEQEAEKAPDLSKQATEFKGFLLLNFLVAKFLVEDVQL